MKKPYIIGIAGGTGSGKTTLTEHLVKSLGKDKVISIAHDHYYRDQVNLTPEERAKTNYDIPQAYETELLVKQLQALKLGQTIKQPIYNFLTDTRSKKSCPITPQPIIIVEGILILAIKELRKLFDLKVFIDTPADIRIIRRINRDMKENNRTYKYITDKYLAQVRPAHLKFVEPSKEYADLVINEEKEDGLQILLEKLERLF